MKQAFIYIVAIAGFFAVIWIARGLQKDAQWREAIAKAPRDTVTSTVWKIDTLRTVVVEKKTTRLIHDTLTIASVDEDHPIDTTVVYRTQEDSVTVTLDLTVSGWLKIRQALVEYPHRTITETKLVIAPAPSDAWWKKSVLILSAGATGLLAGRDKWGYAMLAAAPGIAILTL